MFLKTDETPDHLFQFVSTQRMLQVPLTESHAKVHRRQAKSTSLDLTWKYNVFAQNENSNANRNLPQNLILLDLR